MGGLGERDSLLCHAQWPSAEVRDDEAAAEINWLIDAVTQIRSVRSEMNIKPSLSLPMDVLGASDVTAARLDIHGSALTRLAKVEPIKIVDAAPANAAQIVVGEATYCLPLEGVVDFSEERARLEKELKKLEGEIKRLEGKLGNEKFVANAPAAVVEEERSKLAEYQAQLEQVQVAFERVS